MTKVLLWTDPGAVSIPVMSVVRGNSVLRFHASSVWNWTIEEALFCHESTSRTFPEDDLGFPREQEEAKTRRANVTSAPLFPK